MLQIHNLHAKVADKPILKGLSLSINAGEIHAIMGPNGAGKSTLAYVLGGRPGYGVTGGSVTFQPNTDRPELVEGPSFASAAEEGKSSPSTGSGQAEFGMVASPQLPQSAPNLRQARSANSHSKGRVSRGSMMSSTLKRSALRNGLVTLPSRALIAASSAAGSAAASISLL